VTIYKKLGKLLFIKIFLGLYLLFGFNEHCIRAPQIAHFLKMAIRTTAPSLSKHSFLRCIPRPGCGLIVAAASAGAALTHRTYSGYPQDVKYRVSGNLPVSLSFHSHPTFRIFSNLA